MWYSNYHLFVWYIYLPILICDIFLSEKVVLLMCYNRYVIKYNTSVIQLFYKLTQKSGRCLII